MLSLPFNRTWKKYQMLVVTEFIMSILYLLWDSYPFHDMYAQYRAIPNESRLAESKLIPPSETVPQRRDALELHPVPV